MKVDRVTGWVDEVRRVDSPNYDDRPPGVHIDLAVVHGISLPPGEFGGPWIDRLFTNTLDPDAHPYFREIAHLRVSSHLLIRRTGELVQYVPLTHRAWHAGPSTFAGRAACNDFSVGIELEGTDDLPYEPVQYHRLAQVLGALSARFPDLSPERVVGHCHVAPGRKTDPGDCFDWDLLASLTGVAAGRLPDTAVQGR